MKKKLKKYLDVIYGFYTSFSLEGLDEDAASYVVEPKWFETAEMFCIAAAEIMIIENRTRMSWVEFLPDSYVSINGVFYSSTEDVELPANHRDYEWYKRSNISKIRDDDLDNLIKDLVMSLPQYKEKLEKIRLEEEEELKRIRDKNDASNYYSFLSLVSESGMDKIKEWSQRYLKEKEDNVD